MAESTVIKEPQLEPERKSVEFGQEFHPFDQLEGNVERKGNVDIGDAVIFNKIVLNLAEKGVKIPIDIKMQSFSPGANEVVAPFTPGVEIIDRQFDPMVPFCLKIDASGSLLNKYKLNEETNIPAWEGPGQQFPKGTLELLKKLRVQVQANGSSFEGKPGEKQPLEYGASLWFDFYHKKAEVSSSVGQEGTASKKGRFMLGFPDDPKRLKQVSVKFEFAKEQPQNIPQP